MASFEVTRRELLGVGAAVGAGLALDPMLRHLSKIGAEPNFAEPDFSIPHMPTPRKLPLPKIVCGPVFHTYPKTKAVPHQERGKAKRPSGVVS